MGGDVTIESEPQNGSTFKATISLELLKDDDKPIERSLLYSMLKKFA
jgi:hypothetical protein